MSGRPAGENRPPPVPVENENSCPRPPPDARGYPTREASLKLEVTQPLIVEGLSMSDLIILGHVRKK